MIHAHPAGFITAYPPRIVNNVYFDTFDLKNLEDHLSGMVQRSKLRFRWYGPHRHCLTGVLEVKHKRDRLGWKESATAGENIDFTKDSWRQIGESIQSGLPEELRVKFNSCPCPLFINSYTREYYISPAYNVRITLDYNHKSYEQHGAFPSFNTPLLMADTVVTEFKAPKQQRDSLEEVLDSFPLRPSRNSKFVNCAWSMMY
jgi:hypothetical protein